VESGVFGTLLLADYVQFQAIHAKHHEKQIRTTS
jgi:hypothetical protein